MSSNFISYLTQPSREAPGATFKSYIEDEPDTHEKELNNDEVGNSASQFFDMELRPDLLPGETIIGEADSVLKYTPFCDGKQGMSGKLCATNFKISFVTADRSSYDLMQKSLPPGKRQRNKLITENDIPLTAIDTIYQVGPGGKRKKLTPGSTTSVQTKQLEIHCKDFQIHTFSFKFTPKEKSKQFTNVIVHHAFAKKDDLLFAYTYGQNVKGQESSWWCDTPLFDNQQDWQNEIERCNAERKWRVADVNQHFELSISLPKFFVVPSSLHNHELMRASAQFHNRRIPTWCYTHINGNSLARMAVMDPNTVQHDVGKKMIDSVKVAGDQKNAPSVIDVEEKCPSCREVQESFSRLKKLCLIHSKKDFWLQDLNWYSGLEETRWIQLVRQCLTATLEITDQMQNKMRSIVIQDTSGYDMTCLVSSLVLILLDPHFRTQNGFQSLIQREWVRMGHPFQKYLVLVNQPDAEQVPIFLLFLDCVWQFLKQFPGCFEFTETYLTTLWDTAHIGLFDTFLFNNDHQRSQYLYTENRNIKKLEVKLPPVWAWKLQFASEDLSFFNDPFFVLTHDPQLKRAMSDTRELSRPGKRSQQLRNNLYARKLTGLHREERESFPETLGVLTPQASSPRLHLWTQCYLRWQAPAQILSGGTPSQYLQQCHMVEEILHLHHKALVMQERNARKRPQSNLIFSYGGQPQKSTMPETSSLLTSTFLTSSFPFSPGPATKEQQMNFMTTPVMYLRNSSLDFDQYANSDD